MSYNLSVNAQTVDEVKELVTEALLAIVREQPEHSHDVPQMQEALHKNLDLLREHDDMDIYVSATGSLTWSRDDDGKVVVRGASGFFNIYLIDR